MTNTTIRLIASKEKLQELSDALKTADGSGTQVQFINGDDIAVAASNFDPDIFFIDVTKRPTD